jgi:DNA-binding NtrC family response regulator
VRELKNVIERAMLLEAEDELLSEHLPPEIVHGEASVVAAGEAKGLNDFYPMSLESMEKIMIEKTLAESAGNKSKAARVLGISRQTLREKIKLYRIE